MSPSQDFIKRGLDILGALLGLLLLSPLFVIFIALAMLASNQPVFFRTKYYNLKDAPFEVLQFRLIAGPKAKSNSAIGEIFRNADISERLLLLNVLRGDMSLVGPRPLAHPSAAVYMANTTAEKLRDVRPGLVSWAQVVEAWDPLHEKTKLQRSIEADCHYLANRSLLFDLKILGLALLSKRSYSKTR